MTEYYEYRGVQYANGELPKQFQAPLDGNNLALPNDPAVLRADAAESWNRARAEVLAKTGIVLTVRGWNRSLADQEKFFFQRYKAGKASPFGDYRVYKGVRYGRTNGAAAAIPGTSNHGWGLAVDVVDFGGVGQWNHPRRVAAIGILKKHGWTDDEGRGKIQEPWHLVYNPAKDQRKGTANKPADNKKEEGFLMALSDRDQEAVLWNLREILSAVREIKSVTNVKIKDGNGAAQMPAILERILSVGRRTLAESLAEDVVDVNFELRPEDAASIADTLLERLPAETAAAVRREFATRLQ
jgi:hypothetical protein